MTCIFHLWLFCLFSPLRTFFSKFSNSLASLAQLYITKVACLNSLEDSDTSILTWKYEIKRLINVIEQYLLVLNLLGRVLWWDLWIKCKGSTKWMNLCLENRAIKYWTLFTSKCYILYQILFTQYGEYTLYMQDIGTKLIPTWQFHTYINNTQV